jgi:mycofactocin precursor
MAEATFEAPQAAVRPDEAAKPATPDAGTAPAQPVAPTVEADLLVEDVSIDGMCGVY